MKNASSVFETIYRERRGFFLRVLARRVGDIGIAEEILQEAFIQVCATQQQTIANPDGYLMKAAINLSTDWIRQEKSRGRRERAWAESRSDMARSGEATAMDPSPDQALLAKGEIARLGRALERLSPPVRTAFILHKINGLSHTETAKKMNLSNSTVEKHIMKAMRHVMEAMADDDA